MKTNLITLGVLASVLLSLAACSQSDQGTAPPGAASDVTQATKDVREQTSSSLIAAEVRKSIEQAKKELVTQDIDVTHVHLGKGEHNSHGDRPKAAITPQGDLLIAGRKVDATPQQHALLADYRQQIIGIAEAGMDIGANSADIGITAAKQALWGAFTGKSDKAIEASIKPQTDQLQAAAMQLCKRMPDLLTSQQKLATALPAFQPYATLTQQDVDDCGKDKNGKKGFAVFSD
ncbi:hypothetical protein RHOFW104T7_04940 [Rhodanobacter thiooxydans]|uniref:YggN family protein n=1 Tax=Rhodanobacter thiooxydans TaxID=416169 RepID=A0A154QLU8_9GAMM|nr:hypothetical protein [Rhodanobacter thiooxydans]EIL96681.1 hypothetical protein UUA_17215 [Rhodanobacter thiooxydans LCS2]KZC25140.1 hypothetical protein RHOFW104T7_04940 [Rhodanobacter thiooxydans]MCW0203522.1 YggN family protein [Rhodanobacter thiooxydans]